MQCVLDINAHIGNFIPRSVNLHMYELSLSLVHTVCSVRTVLPIYTIPTS